MVKQIFIFSFILAVLLAACTAPEPGDTVATIRPTRGCKVPVSGGWENCISLRQNTIGRVEIHPTIGKYHDEERTRVVINEKETYWILTEDLKVLDVTKIVQK